MPLADTQILSTVYRVRPLEDHRWAAFVARHPRSTVFHSTAWIEALYRTYGYEPFVLTTSQPGDKLETGVLFCAVASWLTGSRLVSVPFADHCEPLVDDSDNLRAIVLSSLRELGSMKGDYVEIRALSNLEGDSDAFCSSVFYYHHLLDLRPNIETISRNLHKSCVRRKILRAGREHLVCKEGRTEDLLDSFYRMFVRTRRHHGVPPQPKTWFRNLMDCFGEALTIRIACLRERPAAGVLTLRHKRSLVYKYGCSDPELNHLGGVHLLLWRSIVEAKENGLDSFDFGRSDMADRGLITFKGRWGGVASRLIYSRFSSAPRSRNAANEFLGGWRKKVVKPIVRRLPCRVLSAIGSSLYRHMG